MLSNILKTAAVAGLIGVGVAGATATPASAYTHCTRWGNCYSTGGYYHSGYGYYHRPYYARPYGYYHSGYAAPSYYYRSVRVCDAWGCHYVRRAYPRSHVSVGIRF